MSDQTGSKETKKYAIQNLGGREIQAGNDEQGQVHERIQQGQD